MQPFTIFLVIKYETGKELGQKEHIHKSIIEKSKRGNDRAKFELYQLYSKAMLNICYRMMGSVEEAEDMLQDAFLQAFQKLHTFRYESAFGSWLKRIVINTCLNAINKRKLDLVYCEEIKDEEVIEEQEFTPEFSTQNVKKAMEQLPEGGRMVFSLYLLEGYDHGEIAQILNISESTSKSQFMRAKRRIIDIMKTQTNWS